MGKLYFLSYIMSQPQFALPPLLPVPHHFHWAQNTLIVEVIDSSQTKQFDNTETWS